MNNTFDIDEKTKELLNYAILKVLTTQFKKDAKDEHELLKNYGYRVFKADGSFCVQNDNRTIYAEYIGNYRHDWRVRYSYYGKGFKYFKTFDDMKKFDFVNCLNTPMNAIYYELLRYEDGWYTDAVKDVHTKYTGIRNRLRNARRDVKYHECEISDIQNQIVKLQNQIANLQNDLVRHAKHLAEGQYNLDTVKREVGLA